MKLNNENRGERLYKLFIYLVLGILAVLILIPVLWVMVASVKETSEHYGSPWALPSHTSVPWERPDIRTSSSKLVGWISSSICLTNLVPNSGIP